MRGLSSGIGVLHRTYKYSVKGRYLGGIALYALCYEYQNRGGPSRRWTWKKRGIACGQDDVHTLCEALEIPRGTLCNHILRNKRANAQFEKRREEYRLLICEVFAEYRQGDGVIQSLKLREPEEKKIPSVSNFQQTSNQIRASDVACFKYRESISLYLRDLGAIFP